MRPMEPPSLGSTMNTPLLPEEHEQGRNSESSDMKLSRAPSLTMFTSGAGAGAVKNKPLIFLEIITGRVMLFIMLVTFATFALCQWFDYESILAGAQTSSYYSFGSRPCSSAYSETTGCFYGQTWKGEVQNLDNIVSVSLSMSYSNFTQSSAGPNTAVVTVPYQVDLWACYQSEGCGNSFADSYSDNSPSQWHQVMTLGTAAVPQLAYVMPTLPPTPLSVPVFNLTFQNQESIPTNGIVKAYYCSVQYFLPDADPTAVSAVTDSTGVEGLEFVFQITNRPSVDLQRIFCVMLLTFTAVCTPLFYKIVSQEQGTNWLPEQKWCFAYFITLILYQNPLYSTISFISTPSSGAVYASYFLDRLSQAAFLVLWLLFGDAPNYHEHVEGSEAMLAGGKARKNVSVDGRARPAIDSTAWWWFYAYKVAFGLIFLVASIVVLTYQFPDLTDKEHSNVRSPVEAVSNWPIGIQQQFIVFSISYLVLFWVWACWWLINMYIKVPKQLRKKPYMKTRYLQLSFRFFRWQGSLVFLYYVIQYSAVMYSMWSKEASLNGITLTEEINALFRQQTHLFGKVLFLTVYGVVLSFCFLPASFMVNPETSVLASSYVIHERDLDRVVAARRKLIERITYMGVMNQLLTQARPEVLCVELAVQMLNISWEAYYDPEGMETLTSAGPMDVDQHGYTFVDAAYDPAVETYCFICRHKASAKIVIAFRGTVNGQHWKSNLDYGKLPLDIHSMTTPELDKEDGLALSEDEAEEIERRNTFTRSSAHAGAGHTHAAREASVSVDGTVQSAVSGDAAGSGEQRPLTIKETFALTAQKGVHLVESAYTKTTDLAMQAAKSTPGIRSLVQSRVHSGFWSAYNGAGIRDFVHRVVRAELKKAPGKVIVTGHSLGGAMSTFCALDLAVHTLPRANAYYKAMRAGLEREAQLDGPCAAKGGKACSIALYNFGSPKVGNSWFQADFNRWVPDAFRIKVEGDIVTNLPAYGMGFDHVGVEVIIDGNGYGSIIIDQSFVERRLRPRRTGIAVHQLSRYRKGLEGIMNLGIIILEKESADNMVTQNALLIGGKDAAAAAPDSPSPAVMDSDESGVSLSSTLGAKLLGLARDASPRDARVGVELGRQAYEEQEDEEEEEEDEDEQPSFLEGLWSSVKSLLMDKRGQQKDMEKALDLHVEPRQSMSQRLNA